jgi:hypothetical protein
MHSIEAATLDRKSGEAEGSAVPQAFLGNAEFYLQAELSSRPERSVVERSAVSFFILKRVRLSIFNRRVAK